jgi:hypothetical protein
MLDRVYLALRHAKAGGEESFSASKTSLWGSVGLKLESRKAPMQMIVIDHLDGALDQTFKISKQRSRLFTGSLPIPGRHSWATKPV